MGYHAQMGDNSLIRLAYSSSLRADVSEEDIHEIVRLSDARNRDRDITGMLALDHGRVCQILEGPEAAVVALYRKIEVDRRHEGVVELSRKTIEHRAFEAWGMTMRPMVDAAMFALA